MELKGKIILKIFQKSKLQKANALNEYAATNTYEKIAGPDSEEEHLIDFWFVNCPPCIKDHKLIKKEKLDLLKKHNVELVGISTDSDQYLWSNYLKNADYPWGNYRETNDYDNRLSENMLISVFPTYLLVDHEGTILKRSNAFDEI